MNKPTLLYIPGYAGTGSTDSPKMQLLSKYSDVTVLDINGQYRFIDYLNAFDHLDIAQDFDCLCGTSLGGYWAKFVADKYDKPHILLNPVLDPFLQLIGIATNTERDSYLFASPISETRHGIPCLVIVSEHDPVIPSTAAINLFEHNSSFCLIPKNTDHSLNESVNKYDKEVETFLTDSIHRQAV